MRQLIKLSALSLILFSQSALAEKNCLIVVVGGGKEWMSLLPGVKTDISIDVDAAARKEARRTGCRIISGANQTEEEFKEMINKAGKAPYYKPGTTVHLTFTDHGTPQPGNGKGNLYIGKGTAISNSAFSALLKESFPKGSRLTYATNICWGSMTEMVTAYNLDNHFDICGGTSTHPDQFSWNTREVTDVPDKRGPYTAVGLSIAADLMKEKKSPPSVAAFHNLARKGDSGNLFKYPGFVSSTTYARDRLNAKLLPVAVDTSPLDALIVQIGKDPKTFLKNHSLATIKEDFLEAMEDAEKCAKMATNDSFDKVIKEFAELFSELQKINLAALPEPYRSQAKGSSTWLEQNRKSFALEIAKFTRARAEFWAKNQDRMKDPKESAALKTESEALVNRLKQPLRSYFYHIRNLQESKTVGDFLAIAKPSEKERFNKFLACERKPVL